MKNKRDFNSFFFTMYSLKFIALFLISKDMMIWNLHLFEQNNFIWSFWLWFLRRTNEWICLYQSSKAFSTVTSMLVHNDKVYVTGMKRKISTFHSNYCCQGFFIADLFPFVLFYDDILWIAWRLINAHFIYWLLVSHKFSNSCMDNYSTYESRSKIHIILIRFTI